MLVGEVMKSNVVTVKPEESIETVARRLLEHKISGLPVVDTENKVVGILSEGDLIRQAKKIKVPLVTEILGGIVFLENPERFYEELRRMTAVYVKDLMTKKVISTTSDSTVEEVATLMVEHNINRLPVLNNGGKLVGIVTRQDLVRVIYKNKTGEK